MVLRIPKNGLPQDFFLLRHAHRIWFGEKGVTETMTKNGIQPTKSCMLKPEMIIGEWKGLTEDESFYVFEYKKISNKKSLEVFNQLTSQAEVVFPFRRFVNGTVSLLNPEFWMKMAEDPDALDDGEKDLRELVVSGLKRYVINDAVVYDPACSTGRFLGDLKIANPGIRTIGQDLSQEMIRIARNRVDEVHCADSIKPACKKESVDMLICRHLNDGVVDMEKAKALFIAASGTLRKGGIAVLIGFTPVLLDSEWIVELGFQSIRSLGISRKKQTFFQFYIFRKL